MSYIHTDGVEYSDDKKTLIECPEEATEITIIGGVTSIGKEAFFGCSGLTSLVIPEGVTSIGDWAFRGCSGLTSISVDVNNPKYDSRNNCNAIIETETNILIAGCKNTIIPDSVTSIGEGAFRDCSGLTSLVIPEGVKSIGRCAFEGCSGLTSLVIPESVTSIGNYAFYGCSGLKEIRIPKGTRDKFCAILKNYENLLVEYKKEEKEKCAIPESE